MKVDFINSYRIYRCPAVFIGFIFYFFPIGSSCTQTNNELVNKITKLDTKIKNNSIIQFRRLNSAKANQKIKLGHSISNAANEYIPICSPDGNTFYFSAMYRKVFFDFK